MHVNEVYFNEETMIRQSQKDKLKELQGLFDHCLDYIGDDELISNCNNELILGDHDFIVTDGFVNSSMITYTRNAGNIIKPGNKAVQVVTAIRRATYVIICSVKDGKLKTDLRVNMYTIDESYDRILKDREKILKEYDEMNFYLNECRDDYVEQDSDVFELL